MTAPRKSCPNCNSGSLYITKDEVSPAGLEGPDLLPGLGGWGLFKQRAQFRVVVCADCGYTQFFANKTACVDLPNASNWHKL
jgi:predicted nucleic-acid-binding Zn-ribbon protein